MIFLRLKAGTVQNVLLVKANLKNFPLNTVAEFDAETAETEDLIEEGLSILDISEDNEI
jgi:hypothetical protein